MRVAPRGAEADWQERYIQPNMSDWYAIAVLVCTIGAIAGEALALVAPRQIVGLLNTESAAPMTPVLWSATVLSVFYLFDLGLLLFTGDALFAGSAIAIGAMGLLLVVFKKRIVASPWLMRYESTICLILLVNVALTVVRIKGWWSPAP